MLALREAALHTFENEMLDHLGQFSPPLFKTLGEEQMRNAIHFGINQAKNYGFTFRGPVRFYLDLMLLFGSHFDTDPQYPWATEILSDQHAGTQMQRAEKLYAKTMDYRQKVIGSEDAYALEALRNIAIFARAPLALPPDNFIPAMVQEIAQIYPQKAAYLGRANLEALIHKGLGGAQRQRFTTTRGAVLVIVLMLAFGHGCGNDPLYPWIGKTLMDEAIVDPEEKANRLERKALTWLGQVLAYFDQQGVV
jgi:hypothetical protein